MAMPATLQQTRKSSVTCRRRAASSDLKLRLRCERAKSRSTCVAPEQRPLERVLGREYGCVRESRVKVCGLNDRGNQILRKITAGPPLTSPLSFPASSPACR